MVKEDLILQGNRGTYVISVEDWPGKYRLAYTEEIIGFELSGAYFNPECNIGVLVTLIAALGNRPDFRISKTGNQVIAIVDKPKAVPTEINAIAEYLGDIINQKVSVEGLYC